MSLIKKSSAWLYDNITLRKSVINYISATGLSLYLSYNILNDSRLLHKSQKFINLSLKKIDDDGFLQGEGYTFTKIQKTGVDFGYNMGMSLPCLIAYYMMREITLPPKLVKSINTHLSFILSNGVLNNSSGVRMYKWTLYGSKTANSLQMFTGLIERKMSCVSISEKNLTYLKYFINHGFVHTNINMNKDECNYPSFTQAVGIAFAIYFQESFEFLL